MIKINKYICATCGQEINDISCLDCDYEPDNNGQY